MARVAAAWLFVGTWAWAQETKPQPSPQEKTQVIEAASGREQELFDAQFSADVIRSGSIDDRGLPRTLPEILSATTGTSIQKTGPGQGSPFIRGWTGFRNVMLIDGVRLNNSVFRDGPNQYWSTVDPYLIDRLDLVRGPSSVLYGSDAIGGTVYAFTKEPTTFEPGDHLVTRSFYRFSTGDNSHTAREEFIGNVDAFGYVVGGTFRTFDDIHGGRQVPIMPETGYDEYDADAKFLYRLTPKSRVVLAAQRHRTDDAERWHRTIHNDDRWQDTAVGTDRQFDFDQERDLLYAQYHDDAFGWIVDTFKASLSWHRQAEQERRITGSGTHQVRAHAVNTPGAWVQAGKSTEWGYLTFGAEFYHDIVDSSGHNRSAAGVVTPFARGNVADDARYELFGIYVQDEIAVDRLDITPGIRFTWAEVDADVVDPNPAGSSTIDELEDTYTAVTGGLRFLYRVDPNWNAIWGWGMGFRAPALSDTTSTSIVLSGATEIPVEDLDPEVFHTFDVGVRSKYDGWGFSAFAFYSIIDDMITRVPTATPGVLSRDNIGDGYMYGFEVEAWYRPFDEFTVYADWGYAKGEADQMITTTLIREEPIGKVGPSLLHFGVRWQPAREPWWLEGGITAARHQEHLSPTDLTDTQRIPPGGTPGYTVYGLRGGYRIVENARITLAFENIFDEDYRVHGSGQNEPGRALIVGFEAEY
jgi:hemoglobin/transferrin/lactoferrin receptor protein